MGNLSDFQTILWPEVKTSTVGFYRKPYAGFPAGSVIEAPFTRSGAGRKVIDAAGNLVDAAANVPAWTFPIGGSSAGCPYLSFLPSVENLVTYSEDLTNGVWQKALTTISANATTSPDGTINADELVEDGSAGEHFTRTSGISITSGTAYTMAVFAKANTRSRIRIGADDQANLAGRAFYDLSTGSVDNETGSPDETGIINMGNGWYLCYLTATASGSVGGVNLEINLATTGTTVSYAGDGTSGLYLWGGFIKEGSYISPLDYVKTEATAVTRSADVLTTITDLQGDGYFPSDTEGAIIFQYLNNGIDSVATNILTLRDSTTNNQFAIVATNTGVRIYDYAAATYISLNGQNNLNQGELQRLVLSWDSTSINIYLDGFLTYPLADSYSIVKLIYLATDIENGFKFLHFAPTALTASQAEAASSWSSFDLMVSDLGYS